MLFNSVQFAFFFLLFVPIYFLLPHRPRLFFLLAGSCLFYMALIPKYILILGVVILLDFFAGLFIESASGITRKLLLALSIVANLSVLSVFKYYDFFVSNIAHVLSTLGIQASLRSLSLVLPVGLSFHTFQSMSYTIEVYRGKQKAERSLLIYSLYVMFWPQLVAGPIERPQNLIHQFRRIQSFNAERAISGLSLMLIGLAKKAVIADRLGLFVNAVYGNPHKFSGRPLLLATYFFSMQIFFDFSGYSDIAIGAGRVLGFDMMKNFENPYLSTSISEFWKRWHISLSTWFRDYLYIPLGGNRVSTARQLAILTLVFSLSGLWHGSSWNFVIWGLFHAGLYALSLLGATLRQSIPSLSFSKRWSGLAWGNQIVSVLVVFHLVTFSWIFFRATSWADATYIIKNLFSPSSALPFAVNWLYFQLAVIVCLFPWAAPWLARLEQRLQEYPRAFLCTRAIAYYLTIWLIFCHGVPDQPQFIYFQF